jgi:hypothetical protein
VKTVSYSDETSWAEIMRVAEEDDVVVMRDGHAVALITPFDDDDLHWYLRERDPTFLASIARARQQVADHKITSHQDLKRELGID